MAGINGPDDVFSFELRNIPDEYFNYLAKFLKVNIIKDRMNAPDDYLEFSVEFHP